MKTSKKFIAGISAFLLAISTSVAVTVSAVTVDDTQAQADGFSVSVSGSSETVNAGDTFNVTVDLSNVPESGIAGCEFAVDFDSSKFELQSVVENTGLTGDASNAELEIVPDLGSTMINGDTYSCLDYNITDGKVAFLWATGLGEDYFIKQDGTLVTLTFQVKDDVVSDDEVSSIKIDAIREDGDVLFAGVDESGNYVEENVDSTGSANLTIGGGSTSDTTTTTTITTPDITDVTTTTASGGIGDSGEDTTTKPIDPTTMLGDVNFDGNIRVNDIQLIRRHILHIEELSGQALINADVNLDGNVRVNDIQLIRRYILHIDEVLGGDTSAE